MGIPITKQYANLIKIWALFNSKGCFEPISDKEFLIKYSDVSKKFKMAVGKDSTAACIGDWSNANDFDEVVVYYKHPNPMIFLVEMKEFLPHLKKKNKGYVVDLSKIKAYLSKNPARVERFEYDKYDKYEEVLEE